ncbi:MAG: type II toxin-antitoxin system RelE/ParE family toxin [Geminicoccaceae bacterium]|jgi:toxin ParE1/3/4|nr:type II toxin-antitoxin system RelE/ParE family toxin [Geminicoccaceae bacterium]MCB9969754.1 type II toxin-antitoxin system RelE/ParE family toxin [Geminicoccaceae bacterium]HRY26732.1 type II toxin-antitoxin system RelE/ParE family toxin [Geminicoccaceae bacterium]
MKRPRRALLVPAAARDLRRIRAWIAADSGVDRANVLLRALLDVVERIAELPALGTLRPSFGTGVRCFVRKPYLVFYRELDERVQVLRIIDGRRDLQIAWLEDKPVP